MGSCSGVSCCLTIDRCIGDIKMTPPSAEVIIHAINEERKQPEPNEQNIKAWIKALKELHGVDFK